MLYDRDQYTRQLHFDSLDPVRAGADALTLSLSLSLQLRMLAIDRELAYACDSKSSCSAARVRTESIVEFSTSSV